MENSRELFLTAESQAKELAEQLLALKKKMEGHAVAELSLTETRSDLRDLVEELANGAEQTQKIISTLGKIGTTEILEKMEKVHEYVSDEFSKSIEAISDFRDSFEKKISQLRMFLFVMLGLNGVLIILQVLSLLFK